MEFYYLIIFESTKIGKIDPITIENDDPKLLERTFEKLGYTFDKPLKRKDGFTKLYKKDSIIYYKVIPCLKINNRFFELKELPVGS